jgi:VCBS repeat-containing protein
MKVKLAIVFASAGLLLAGSKSYEISLSQPSKAGSLDLQAGDYKVAVAGTKATFTALKTGKSVETDVTVQAAEKKFALTMVDAENSAGTNKIHEIDLAGTTTKVMFQ